MLNYQGPADEFSHDEGLAHPHLWACEPATIGGLHPVVADTSCVQTPSSVLHDDLIFGS